MANEFKFPLEAEKAETAADVQSLMGIDPATGMPIEVELELIAQEAGKHVGDAVKITSNALPTLGDANKNAEVYGGTSGRALTYNGSAVGTVNPYYDARLFWDGELKTWEIVEQQERRKGDNGANGATLSQLHNPSKPGGYGIDEVVRDAEYNEYVSLANSNSSLLTDSTKWKFRGSLLDSVNNGSLSFNRFLKTLSNDSITEFYPNGKNFTIGRQSIGLDGKVLQNSQYNRFGLTTFLPIKSGAKLVGRFKAIDAQPAFYLYSSANEDSFIKSSADQHYYSNGATTDYFIQEFVNDTGADAYYRLFTRSVDQNSFTQEELEKEVWYYITSDVKEPILPQNIVDIQKNIIRVSTGSKYPKIKSLVKPFYNMVAHRGYRGFGATENTPQSFYDAKSIGCKYVECDLQQTLDGHFVLMHNESINATMLLSNGSAIGSTVNVSSKTLAELKSGYIYNNTVGVRHTIYTLEEFARDCHKLALHPIIEIKDTALTTDTIKNLVEVVGNNMNLQNCVFMSGNYSNCKELVKLKIGLNVHYLKNSPNTLDLKRIAQYGMHLCHGAGVSQDTIDFCKQNGMDLHIWGVNNLTNLNNAINAGAQFISGDTFGDIDHIKRNNGVVYTSKNTFRPFTQSDVTLVNGIANVDVNGQITTPNIPNPTSYGLVKIEAEFEGTFQVFGKSLNQTFSSSEIKKHTYFQVINGSGDFTVYIKNTGATVGRVNRFDVEFVSI